MDKMEPQPPLNEEFIDKFIEEHNELVQEHLNKYLSFALREYFTHWILYGVPEEVPKDYSNEIKEMYEKASKSAQNQWSNVQLDQRFNEMKYIYLPNRDEEIEWKKRLNILAKALENSQKAYIICEY